MRQLLGTAILLATTGVAQAQLCNTSDMSGLHFELTRPSSAHGFSSYREPEVSGYQIGWVNSYTSRERFDVEAQAGRDGVFTGESFLRRPEQVNGHPAMIRYYTAILDNCEEIYLRLPEVGAVAQNRQVPPPRVYDEGYEYLRKRSADIAARVDLNTVVLKQLEGKSVAMLPVNDNYLREPWVSREVDGGPAEVMPSANEAKFAHIISVIEAPFLWQARQLSPTTLEVHLKGSEGHVLVPGYWDEVIAYDGPEPAKEAVRGTSRDELLIAKGRPERIEQRTWVELSDDLFEVWIYPSDGGDELMWMLDDHVRKVIKK